MKTLYLVRHGKAQSRYEDIPDFERTLIETGKEATREIAERLAAREVTPGVIVTSPAPRAEETARIIAKTLGYRTKKILRRKSIYDQPPGALMDVVRGMDDKAESAMLVGHDMAVSDMVLELSGDTKVDIPTSGVAALGLDIGTWADAAPGCGRVLWFEDPKRPPVRPKKKELRDRIEKELADRIGMVVDDLAVVPADSMTKPVAKAAGKLAKKIAGRIGKHVTTMKPEKRPEKSKKSKI